MATVHPGLPEQVRRRRESLFEDSVVEWNEHLIWTGAVTGEGYGNYWHPVELVNIPAHVYAWEQIHGPTPDGYELHHKCHVPRCVADNCLQLVTRAEHRRIEGEETTHCPRGHLYDEANTYLRTKGNGRRQCRTCHREQEYERRHNDER